MRPLALRTNPRASSEEVDTSRRFDVTAANPRAAINGILPHPPRLKILLHELGLYITEKNMDSHMPHNVQGFIVDEEEEKGKERKGKEGDEEEGIRHSCILFFHAF